MAKPTSATLPNTQVRTLKSRATGKNYEISIALPAAYAREPGLEVTFGPQLTAWPVVYVMDPMWFFGLVTELTRYMMYMQTTTDAIVVGVGYPLSGSLEQAWRQGLALRTHDLTPVRSETSEQDNGEWLKLPVQTGGGAAFLQFLRQELIPLIEQDFHADPARRILMGHSHGGLFALYAMFQEPRSFHAYVASSPSLFFAKEYPFGLESEYAKKHKTLPAQLFLSAGDREVGDDDPTLVNVYRFASILESRNYKGFSLTRRIFLGLNHAEVAGPAFHAGLMLALKA